jgi:TPR repeat protein
MHSRSRYLPVVLLALSLQMPMQSIRAQEPQDPPAAEQDAPAKADANLPGLFAITRAALAGPELDAAITTLDGLATQGNARAAYELAEYYGRHAAEPDAAAALPYYRMALDGGDERALIRLGDIHHDQAVPGLDAAQSVEFYRRAAEAGNAIAMQRLGEAYATGDHLPRDLDQAVRWFQDAAAAGNGYGALRLGDLYRTGEGGLDPQLAVEAYRDAAEANNNWAQIRLGDLYRDGELVDADPLAALEWYEAARRANNAAAFMRIANGLVAGTVGEGEREAGLAMLEQGASAGEPRAALTLARLLLADQEADPDRALALLEAAKTDPAAQSLLVRLFAEGIDGRIAVDKARARLALANVQAAGGPSAAADAAIVATLAINAPGGPAAVGEAALAVDPAGRPGLIRRLLALDANAYVAVLQQRLASDGLYSGPISGVLTGSTISSINAFCRQSGIEARCLAGPLSPGAINALVRLL